MNKKLQSLATVWKKEPLLSVVIRHIIHCFVFVVAATKTLCVPLDCHFVLLLFNSKLSLTFFSVAILSSVVIILMA